MAAEDKWLFENGILSEFHFQPHTDEIIHRRVQPNEHLILERNAELRKQPEAFRKSDMSQIACIPLIMWEEAKRNGYDLDCKDREVADKELWRFLNSEKGRICRVREKI